MSQKGQRPAKSQMRSHRRPLHKPGLPSRSFLHARRAMDRGEYAWMGELSRGRSTAADVIGLGLTRIQSENEPARAESYAAAVSKITTL